MYMSASTLGFVQFQIGRTIFRRILDWARPIRDWTYIRLWRLTYMNMFVNNEIDKKTLYWLSYKCFQNINKCIASLYDNFNSCYQMKIVYV